MDADARLLTLDVDADAEITSSGLSSFFAAAVVGDITDAITDADAVWITAVSGSFSFSAAAAAGAETAAAASAANSCGRGTPRPFSFANLFAGRLFRAASLLSHVLSHWDSLAFLSSVSKPAFLAVLIDFVNTVSIYNQSACHNHSTSCLCHNIPASGNQCRYWF